MKLMYIFLVSFPDHYSIHRLHNLTTHLSHVYIVDLFVVAIKKITSLSGLTVNDVYGTSLLTILRIVCVLWISQFGVFGFACSTSLHIMLQWFIYESPEN